MLWWTAFSLGLLGGLHCVGMCGPIAISLPYTRQSSWARYRNVLLYNSGRILTYGVLGAVFGLLGQAVWLAGLQQYLSISIGVLFLIAVFFSGSLARWWNRFGWYRYWNTLIKKGFNKLLNRPEATAFFGIGLLNGLLPCGLVYLAIVGAVGTGSLWEGGLFMMLFGLGTWPTMLTLGLAGQQIGPVWRSRLRKLTPLVYLAFAIVLISRGFNIQLPAEFNFWSDSANIPECH